MASKYEVALGRSVSGDPGAQCTVGYCLQYGIGVSRDPVAAIRWYRKAARGGSAPACFSLALSYDSWSWCSQERSKGSGVLLESG